MTAADLLALLPLLLVAATAVVVYARGGCAPHPLGRLRTHTGGIRRGLLLGFLCPSTPGYGADHYRHAMLCFLWD